MIKTRPVLWGPKWEGKMRDEGVMGGTLDWWAMKLGRWSLLAVRNNEQHVWPRQTTIAMRNEKATKFLKREMMRCLIRGRKKWALFHLLHSFCCLRKNRWTYYFIDLNLKLEKVYRITPTVKFMLQSPWVRYSTRVQATCYFSIKKQTEMVNVSGITEPTQLIQFVPTHHFFRTLNFTLFEIATILLSILVKYWTTELGDFQCCRMTELD